MAAQAAQTAKMEAIRLQAVVMEAQAAKKAAVGEAIGRYQPVNQAERLLFMAAQAVEEQLGEVLGRPRTEAQAIKV